MGQLSFGQVLDATWAIYRKGFVSFVAVGLLSQVPYAILVALTGVVVGGSSAVGALALVAIFSFLAGVLLQAASIRLADSFYEGKPTSALDAVRQIGPVLLPLALLTVLLGIGTSILTVFLIIPGLIFYFRFVLAIPGLVIGRDTVWSSFGDAWRMSKGAFWRILGASIVFSLAIGVVDALISVVAGKTGLSGSQQAAYLLAPSVGGYFNALGPGLFAGDVVSAVTGSVIPILLTVLYHDRRAAMRLALEMGPMPGQSPAAGESETDRP